MNLNNNIPEDFDRLEKYAPTLASIPKKNCFNVPEGYFETLPEVISIVSKFNSNASAIKKQSVPDGYFEGLANTVRSQAIISDIDKSNPFRTPANYFEYLPERVMEKIQSEGANSASWLSKLLIILWNPRIAFAFGAFLILLVSGIYLSDQQSTGVVTTEEMLSDISKQDLSSSESLALLEEEDLFDEFEKLEVADVMHAKVNEVASSDGREIEEWIHDEVDIQTLINEL